MSSQDPQADNYDPFDTPEYAEFVASLEKECKCLPYERRPCDGLLAGGPCDMWGHHGCGDMEGDNKGWEDDDD